MSGRIDPRAAIAAGASIGENVEIGPFAVVGGDAVVGDGCRIGPHAVITGRTTIGRDTVIHTGAVVGDEPQDLHYRGEDSRTVIGARCVLREYVTIHRGTEEGSVTRVGDDCLLMAFSHLGHNCQVGDQVVIANATLLAGRVEVSDHAFLSAHVLVHQFVRIGRLAMIGGGNAVGQDVPPFCMLQDGAVQGANLVGLRRSDWDPGTRDAVREAIRITFFQGLSRPSAIARIRSEVATCPEVEEFVRFLEGTRRGLMSGRARRAE